ncbi:MAG: formyltransferase family protein [Pseudomonadota bacterium]
MKILLIAEESSGIQFLKWLDRTDHEIQVAASPGSRSLTGNSVWSTAHSLKRPATPISATKDAAFSEAMRALEIDLLISIRSRFVLAEALLAVPRIGAFNLHSGPLPAYAGINVVPWAIYNGEAEHGVTVHWMTATVDAGDIAYQDSFPIGPDDTGASLTGTTLRSGLALMQRLVRTAAGGERIPAIPQDQSKRAWYGPEIPNDGFVDWRRGAVDIDRFVRACNFYPFPSPWGYAKAMSAGRVVELLETQPIETAEAGEPGSVRIDGESCTIACGTGALRVSDLLVEGEHVPARELLANVARLDPV